MAGEVQGNETFVQWFQDWLAGIQKRRATSERQTPDEKQSVDRQTSEPDLDRTNVVKK